MKPSQDAYGRALYDFFKGDTSIKEIVERDDGYIDVGVMGPAGYFIDFDKWMTCEKQAIKFARGRVLDIGCGAGRVLKYLAKQGHDVVGIDNSPLTVKVCKERGFKHVYERSITRIGPDIGIFDTIVMYGNNFGLFGSYKRARWLLRRMKGITSPDARIIVQTVDTYGTTLPEHLAYHKLNRKRNRMAGQLRLRIRYKKYIGQWFDYLIVSQREMQEICAGTGWHVEKTFDTNLPIYTAIIMKD